MGSNFKKGKTPLLAIWGGDSGDRKGRRRRYGKGGLQGQIKPRAGCWALSCGSPSGRRQEGEWRQQRHLVPQHGAVAVNRGRCSLSCDWARGIGVQARVTRGARFNCDSAVSNCHSFFPMCFFFSSEICQLSEAAWTRPHGFTGWRNRAGRAVSDIQGGAGQQHVRQDVEIAEGVLGFVSGAGLNSKEGAGAGDGKLS